MISRALVCFGLFTIACGGSEQKEDPTAPTTAAPTAATTTAQATTAATASETTAQATTGDVSVYFSSGDGTDCGLVVANSRQIPAGTDPIEAAFRALVGGPTEADAANQAGSLFSQATAASLRSVSLEDGLLVVDLADVRVELTNASSSCGSEALLAQLNATAFQFEAVVRVRYEIEGDCDTFYNWLQRECASIARNEASSSSDAADG